MGCLWQPLNGTIVLHHNMTFPKRDGPSIQILHWKSVIFDVVLLSPNRVPGQATKRGTVKDVLNENTAYIEIVDHINQILLVLLNRYMLSWVEFQFVWVICSKEYCDRCGVGRHFFSNDSRENNLVPSCIVSWESSVQHITFSDKKITKILYYCHDTAVNFNSFNNFTVFLNDCIARVYTDWMIDVCMSSNSLAAPMKQFSFLHLEPKYCDDQARHNDVHVFLY